MISFLIPFRDADGTRTAGMEWIVARWRTRYPDAEFILASDDGIDPFCKSMAVNRAFARSTGGIIVILDADTWVLDAPFRAALRAVESGRAPWAVPADVSWRLTREKSLEIMARQPAAEMPTIRREHVEQANHVVGFCHILPRAAMEKVGGMDERFRGWGGEDGAFTVALDGIWGQHLKVSSTLISLWHERPRDAEGKRIWLGQESRTGNNRVWRGYALARGNGPHLLRVLRQPGGPLGRSRRAYTGRHGGRPMTRVLFTCKTYPALLARIDGRAFKFSAGKLVANSEDVKLLEAFADQRPHYEISWEPMDEPAQPAPEPEPRPDRKALQAALRAVGEKTGGTNAELADRLRAAYERDES